MPYSISYNTSNEIHVFFRHFTYIVKQTMYQINLYMYTYIYT